MTYSHDYTTECELDGYEAPVTFSTYINDAHPNDLPTLTLESVRLGRHIMGREAVVAWLGAAEVARLEKHYQPEEWVTGEDAACDRADAWRRENAA